MKIVTWVVVMFLLVMTLVCFILSINRQASAEDRKLDLSIGVVCLTLLYIVACLGGLLEWRLM